MTEGRSWASSRLTADSRALGFLLGNSRSPCFLATRKAVTLTQHGNTGIIIHPKVSSGVMVGDAS